MAINFLISSIEIIYLFFISNDNPKRIRSNWSRAEASLHVARPFLHDHYCHGIFSTRLYFFDGSGVQSIAWWPVSRLHGWGLRLHSHIWICLIFLQGHYWRPEYCQKNPGSSGSEQFL